MIYMMDSTPTLQRSCTLQTYLAIFSIIVGITFWIMLCLELIEEHNIRAKIDTFLFFGGAMTIALLDLNASDHTTAFFSAVFSTAVIMRALSYFKFEISRDVVVSAQNTWSTLRAHPLACIVCLFGAWNFIDDAIAVLG